MINPASTDRDATRSEHLHEGTMTPGRSGLRMQVSASMGPLNGLQASQWTWTRERACLPMPQ